jgi:hypothetical protein
MDSDIFVENNNLYFLIFENSNNNYNYELRVTRTKKLNLYGVAMEYIILLILIINNPDILILNNME